MHSDVMHNGLLSVVLNRLSLKFSIFHGELGLPIK